MGRKNKRGGGGAKAAPPTASGNKEAEPAPVPTLSKSAKRDVTELVTQLLESAYCCLFTLCGLVLNLVFSLRWGGGGVEGDYLNQDLTSQSFLLLLQFTAISKLFPHFFCFVFCLDFSLSLLHSLMASV